MWAIKYHFWGFLGVRDEMMPLFQVGPVTHEEVMESLRLFGKYIIPHFQEKAQKAASADN
jgi:hypothetical protein